MFPLPPGESRVGSDAACEICLRGEGILPVHAYVRSDGDKILIRPASEASNNSRAAITVDGSLITGPATVLEGQRLAIGSLQLQLERNGPPNAGMWSRNWLRLTAYTLGGVAAILLLGLAYLRFILLDEDALKMRFRSAVHDVLGRPIEDVEIGTVKVRMLDGRLDIVNLRVKERCDCEATATHFIQIPNLMVKLDAWRLLLSWGRDVRNLEILADGEFSQKPELILERSKADGALNIEDILQRMSASKGRVPLNYSHLDFVFRLNNGAVRLRDPFTNIGETSLENIALALRLPGQGQPLNIEKCEMRVSAVPAPIERGVLAISGKVSLIDAACAIDTSKFSAEALTVDVKNCDLARVFEHFGYAWQPQNSNVKVVLGKPISGHVELNAKSLNDLTFTQGSINSQSLLSIKEDKLPPVGSMPMELKCKELNLVREGRVFVPRNIDLKLESWSDPSRRDSVFLNFGAQGQMNPNKTSTYSVELECGLQELLNTDVGRRLKLNGTLGGAIKGHADLIIDVNNGMKIDAQFNGRDTFVMVPEADDATKPPDRRRMIKQPLPLSFDCYGNAQPSETGGFAYIDVARFSLKASSFAVRSETPSRIDFKQKEDKLSAEAQFKLDLHGREFCREFSPILSLFGFKTPLEEDFALRVTVFGRDDIVSIGAEGTATRQWSEDPAPVKLIVLLDYNKPALLTPTKGVLPYLSLTMQTKSSSDKPLDVRVEAHCTRHECGDVIELMHLTKDGKDSGQPGLTIDADVATLRDRFRPYIEYFLQPRDKDKSSSNLLNI
jgi:hypothetical protein